MNLVDSCGWLEYFANGSNASFFATAIENIEQVIVPTICVTEVFKRITQQRSEKEATLIANSMHLAHIVTLDFNLALNAAKFGLNYKLPLADGIILATAYKHNATIWTQDADFKNIKGVNYIEKSRN